MSHLWLPPRLPAFRKANPEVQIRIISRDEPSSPADGSIDMVIRFGRGEWNGGETSPPFKSEIVPMVSPGFLATHGDVKSVDDGLASPLIEYDAPDESWVDWNDWLTAAGRSVRKICAALSFSRYSDAIQATASDQGAILVWRGHAQVPGPAVQPRGDFHLVVGGALEPHGEYRMFTDWLIAEARPR